VGLAGLAFIACLVQGPLTAVAQLFDVPGHVRAVVAALSRFRRAGRLLAVLLGVTVLSWTVRQVRSFGDPQRLEFLADLMRTRGARDVGLEQGLLAALTPLRDLCGLADNFPLLLAAAVVVFRLSADRWESDHLERPPVDVAPWTTPVWMAAWLYVLYRVACALLSPAGFPVQLSLWVEPVVVPLLMLTCDGLLFAWVLTELRHAISDASDAEVFEAAAEAVRWTPTAAVVCLLVLPARTAATATYLSLPYLRSAGWPAGATGAEWLLRGWGLAALQAAGLVLLPLAGAAAWGPARGGTARLWLVLMKAEGGRLLAVVAGSCGLAAGVSAAIHALILSLPPQPWVLLAADAYAHYATLPLGLMLLATLVELTDRASRRVAAPPASEPAVAAA
jgi:hypothetical protein